MYVMYCLAIRKDVGIRDEQDDSSAHKCRLMNKYMEYSTIKTDN